jgi:hypothetical protein
VRETLQKVQKDLELFRLVGVILADAVQDFRLSS